MLHSVANFHLIYELEHELLSNTEMEIEIKLHKQFKIFILYFCFFIILHIFLSW